MTSPDWDIQFAQPFHQTQAKYTRQLVLDVVSSSKRKVGAAEQVERSLREQAKFEDFLGALTFYMESKRDPNTLPPAKGMSGSDIPDYFEFQRAPWFAYIFRDARDRDHPLASVQVLYHERDKPRDLQNALAMLEAYDPKVGGSTS
jgi:hypothetical protein